MNITRGKGNTTKVPLILGTKFMEVGIIMRPANSSNDSVITDEAEDSIASRTRNKRKRKHNKTRRRILTDQQQEDEDDENNSYEYYS